MLKSTDRVVRRNDRVRKRAPNAYIAELEERAARPRRGSTDEDQETVPDDEEDQHEQDHEVSKPATPQVTQPNGSGSNVDGGRSPHSDADQVHQNGLHSVPAADLRNPLDPVNSDAFTVNNGSKPYFLGVSSNWSFGRRVLSMVHSKISEAPLSAATLLFEGSTYSLGWDGQRTSANVDSSVLPAADFAIYLIDAVRFHCGQLFHMFDETTFMVHFHNFYDEPSNQRTYPRLWYIHFLIILAFGKGFVVRAKNEKQPPGSELFVQAMKLLPDISYMYSDTIQSIEMLCCAALYLQCLDNRSAAYNITWWTVYVLDRQMTALMGVPMSLSDDDITAPLPSFAGSLAKQKALDIHIKLARANAAILQTVYGKPGGRSERFLASMKEALRTIAEAKDELNLFCSLNLHQPGGGISRLWATLHLFHHQTLILATRPLLYSFLQKRLETTRPLRVSSSSDARSLIRVCVSSAQQSLKLLETLQSQGLLGKYSIQDHGTSTNNCAESFVPFDREATFSSSVVLSVAATVDPSLVRDRDSRFITASSILDDMVSCGNRVADFQRRELDQLDISLRRLRDFPSPATSSQQVQHENSASAASYIMTPADIQIDGSDQPMPNVDIGRLLDEWNSEDSLNGEQLMAVVDSLDYGQLNWPGVGDFDTWT
ncbi:MAG: hypothetical protein Q9165_003864 [Trypethelium subeluteriae]